MSSISSLRKTTAPGVVGDVVADFERRLVDLRRQAAVLDEIVKIVLEPAQQAFAARIDELPRRGGIG